MRAITISAERRLVETCIDDPPLQPGSARVTVARCGICGSDLHARNNPRYVAGCVLGHEIVGEIVELADDSDGWAIGDRVGIYHAVACQECEMCSSGNTHMCFNALETSLGLGSVQGGYAEQVVVPTQVLVRIPEGLPYDDAAIAEPLSIAIHGVDKARVQPGDAVCVLGAGPIGAMVACALRARGIADVVIVEPNELRRAKVAEMGFHAVGLDNVADQVIEVLGGRRPIAVLECSGHVTAASLAADLVAYTGRIVLQGVPSAQISLSQFTLVQKEIEMVGAASCTPSELAEAMDMLARGTVPAAQLVTGVISFADAQRTFDELVSPSNSHMKVLLNPALR